MEKKEQPDREKVDKIIRSWKRAYEVNHESFTPLQIMEQIVIFSGVLAFLAGFWYVFYRIVVAIFH